MQVEISNNMAGNEKTNVISHAGYCPCCCNNVTFYSESEWLRDNFFCPICKSIPRERALMVVIEKYYPNWRNLSIHEFSPVLRATSLRLKNECKKYTYSHFFPKETPGHSIYGVRNENIEKTTFNNASFDIIITQDVLEHIFNPIIAFSEMNRLLRSDGAHIFTVPLVNKNKDSVVWSIPNDDGTPHFIHEPEYHGNPIDIKGSPVTMHWGYDIVEIIEKHGNLHTIIEKLDMMEYGIRAEFIEVLISKKKYHE